VIGAREAMLIEGSELAKPPSISKIPPHIAWDTIEESDFAP